MTASDKSWCWVDVPFCVVLAFVAAFPCAFALNWVIRFCLEATGHFLRARDGLITVLPFDGALAAAFVVLGGALAAPAHRNRVAVVLLMLGGGLAWFLIDKFYFPDERDQGFVHLWRPIAGTWLGGLAAVVVVWFVAREHSPTDNALRSPPGAVKRSR